MREKQTLAVQVGISLGRSLQRDACQKYRHWTHKDQAVVCVSPRTQLGNSQGLRAPCLFLGQEHIWLGSGTSGQGWDTHGKDPAARCVGSLCNSGGGQGCPRAPRPRGAGSCLLCSCARWQRGPGRSGNGASLAACHRQLVSH